MKLIMTMMCAGLMILLSVSCSSSEKLNYRLTFQKHQPEALKNDLSVIKEALREAHPGLYWYTSRARLDSIFSNVSMAITEPMTSLDFYKLAAPAVSAVRDGHTRLIFPATKKSEKQKQEEKEKGIAPLKQFKFRIINDRLFIIKNASRDTTTKNGAEVMRINGFSAGEMLDNFRSLFSSDGYNQTFLTRYTEKQLPGLFKTYYNRSDSIVLTVNGTDHLITSSKGASDSLSSNNKKFQKRDSHEREKRRYRGYDEEGKHLLDIRFVNTPANAAVLTVRSFSFPADDHARFFKEAFDEIHKRDVKNLVLDLRNNPGGKLSACKILFSYLIDKEKPFLSDLEVKDKWYPARKYFDNKLILDIQNIFLVKKAAGGYRARLGGLKPVRPQKRHFDGNLFVLINGYSFSASTLLAANLHGNKRGVFIGEETGGGYNKCTAGIIPLVTLPETRVKLRLPLIKIAPAVNREVEGHGIFPDYPVIPSLKDLLNEKDTELDFALKLIASEK